MVTYPFEPGLREIGDGIFAFLQPDGNWGLSNAGLVAKGRESLLVDTLFDEAHTRRMLAEMRRIGPAAEAIHTVVNTHANGDHCWGNSLLKGSRIVSSQAAADEMTELMPSKLALLMQAARVVRNMGPIARAIGKACSAMGLSKAADFVDAAPYVLDAFGQFDFNQVELVTPTETFSERLDLAVDGRSVELIEVGPAHTRGDILVHIPDAKVVFSGDILFEGCHPLAWEGPLSGWVRACERILSLNPQIVVPGHGPIADAAAVKRMADYLRALQTHAETCFSLGMTEVDAAREFTRHNYEELAGPERAVVSIRAAYRELRGEHRRNDAIEAFGAMARLVRESRP